ncbi:MAG: hypothetical protein J7545_10670, partial [Roseofilum sp. SBFL]|uniref:RHS repeat-associated core domain-containing protein n=1 Tax=Roseofilum sp. SBFL TaxID=2821496 RepID=UPI001B184889
DEGLGQYYLRQRYYDASTGRFTRRDTYEGRLNEPITLNKYLYANGNPVSYVDPSGFYSLEIGYKIFHADLVISDAKGVRVYGAQASNLEFSPDHLGFFINLSNSQGGSVGFGNIDTYERCYQPNYQRCDNSNKFFSRSDYIGWQTLRNSNNNSDMFPEHLEKQIQNSFRRVELSETPYNFHRKNSNAVAFQVLEEVLGYRPIPNRLSVPGWNRNPYTGLTSTGKIAITDRVTTGFIVSTSLLAATSSSAYIASMYAQTLLLGKGFF